MSKLSQLKNKDTDRAKVLAWLAHINETDQRCIAEVMEACTNDPEARKYYLMKYEQDVLEQHLIENAA